MRLILVSRLVDCVTLLKVGVGVFMKLVYLLLLSSLLAGCGLKGPLIVPKNPQHLGLFEILSP